MSLQIKAILYLTVLMTPYDSCLTMEKKEALETITVDFF